MGRPDHGLAVPECVTRRQEVVNQARTLLKTTHTKTTDVIAACPAGGDTGERLIMNETAR